jgi:hypothetical protein
MLDFGQRRELGAEHPKVHSCGESLRAPDVLVLGPTLFAETTYMRLSGCPVPSPDQRSHLDSLAGPLRVELEAHLINGAVASSKPGATLPMTGGNPRG